MIQQKEWNPVKYLYNIFFSTVKFLGMTANICTNSLPTIKIYIPWIRFENTTVDFEKSEQQTKQQH